jgi:hypothetical protein
MTQENQLIENAYAQHIGQHYQRASEELLHAYQRNKEAGRHHEAGALKAALHHAKLSKHHAFNAHEHLKEVLSIHEKMTTMATPASHLPVSKGGDLLQ